MWKYALLNHSVQDSQCGVDQFNLETRLHLQECQGFLYNYNKITRSSSNQIISGIEFSNTNGPKSLFMDVQRQGNWCV